MRITQLDHVRLCPLESPSLCEGSIRAANLQIIRAGK